MSLSNYTIFSGSSHPQLAQSIADAAKKPLGKIQRTEFSCGEKYISLEETVRGKEVFLVQTCREQHVNDDLMELFLMINTVKQSFGTKVHVIIPYLGYARQDKVHAPREPISAKLIADLMVTSGADHVITFQLHADQTQAFFDVPVDNVMVHKLFAEHFKKKNLENVTVVSPDAGGAKNAKKFADYLGASLAILHKSRPAHNQAITTHVVGEVEGKTCIIYDDLIDTAGSVIAAQEALLNAGAHPDVYLAATHPVFSGPAQERLSKANFKEVVVTDSLPIEKEKQFEGLVQLNLGPLIGSIIQSIAEDKSVSSLFY